MKMTFQLFLWTPKITIVGPEVLRHPSGIDAIANNGQRCPPSIVLDLPEARLTRTHPSRSNLAHRHIVTTLPGLRSIGPHPHVSRRLLAAITARGAESTSARRAAIP